MSSIWQKKRERLLWTYKEMERLGLVSGSSGNASLRLDKDGDRELLGITRTGARPSQMTLEDIVVVDFEGEPVEGEFPPSSETLMHVAIYRARPDVNAVLHTHSIHASVAAVAGIDIPPVVDEVVVRVGGTIKVAEYAFPGTQELGEKVCQALEERNAALIRNHGAVGVGGSLEEALEVCQLVERASQIYILSYLLGRTTLLPPEVIEIEKNIFHMRRESEGSSET